MNLLFVPVALLLCQAEPKAKEAFELPKITARSKELDIAVQFTEHTNRFGVTANNLFDPTNTEERKRLTRDSRGITNNTCFRADGYEYLFGTEIPGVRWVRDKGKLLKEAGIEGVAADRGWRSVLAVDFPRLRIEQQVQIIPGEQTLLHDTMLVRYILTNQDNKPHTVGLRIMLDTFVGSNDGLPWLVPGVGKPALLVETLAEVPQKDLPRSIRVLESDLLDDPNAVVAEMGLRLRDHEAPERVVICRWPQNSEARWGGTGRPGDWKYEPMNANPKAKDSCVVLYWAETAMKPGETRSLGFTYGLGKLAGAKDGEQIAAAGGSTARLLVAGANTKKSFPVAIYVKGEPKSVKLELPEGVTLAEGQKAEQNVPAASSAGYAVVTWEVKVAKPGEYTIKADVAGLGVAAEKVRVHEKSLFED